MATYRRSLVCYIGTDDRPVPGAMIGRVNIARVRGELVLRKPQAVRDRLSLTDAGDERLVPLIRIRG
jgi:hypothetical protein